MAAMLCRRVDIYGCYVMSTCRYLWLLRYVDVYISMAATLCRRVDIYGMLRYVDV